MSVPLYASCYSLFHKKITSRHSNRPIYNNNCNIFDATASFQTPRFGFICVLCNLKFRPHKLRQRQQNIHQNVATFKLFKMKYTGCLKKRAPFLKIHYWYNIGSKCMKISHKVPQVLNNNPLKFHFNNYESYWKVFQLQMYRSL